jgi:hypothetical protein
MALTLRFVSGTALAAGFFDVSDTEEPVASAIPLTNGVPVPVVSRLSRKALAEPVAHQIVAVTQTLRGHKLKRVKLRAFQF